MLREEDSSAKENDAPIHRTSGNPGGCREKEVKESKDGEKCGSLKWMGKIYFSRRPRWMVVPSDRQAR